jgi:predicted outer membrane repeat protein
VNGADATITGCTITGNTAGSSGGGIHVDGPSSVSIGTTTICSNTPDQVNAADGYTDEGDNCISDVCDTDLDGTPDCIDNCPDDPGKVEPGVCGCGVAETDTDEDGTVDCIDDCPDDPEKTEPGDCGCGFAETDTDGDGTPDCNDDCVTWPGDCSDGGQTILVNLGDDLTITEAIAAAPDGGTVVVGAGTWNEAIDFAGRAITIQAASGFGSGATVLDGTGLETSIVTFANGEGAGSVLRGFTLRNGTVGTTYGETETTFQMGGALFVELASPTIIECVFEDNEAEYGGAGFFRESESTIQSCVFRMNDALTWGGALVSSLSDIMIDDCLFENNTSGGDGGAIAMTKGSPVLRNSTFVGNTAFQDGGAVNWIPYSEGFASIEECTFTGNNAAVGEGGGVNAVSMFVTLEISDTLACNNDPSNVSGLYSDLGGNTLCACAGDLNGDGEVSGADLSIVLGLWGPCNGSVCLSDLNGDGNVNGADLSIILGYWGACP